LRLHAGYPSVGDGMNYNGHGLMWAESPWSGHYVINSPIWVSAQYTQFTRPGWLYLPVGKGSGELPDGGTFVSLVDPATGDFTMIAQTMEYNMSMCFKDTHDPFVVAASQSVTFQTKGLVERGIKTLQLRRTVLVATSSIDPVAPYNDTNTYVTLFGHSLGWTLKLLASRRLISFFRSLSLSSLVRHPSEKQSRSHCAIPIGTTHHRSLHSLRSFSLRTLFTLRHFFHSASLS
jgi:hypothetical protein